MGDTCVMCGGDVVREAFTQDFDIHGETFRATGEHERCLSCTECVWRPGMKDFIADALDQYRRKHGLPSDDEQIALAKKMGVTAFCKALGVKDDWYCQCGALPPKEAEEKLKRLAKEVEGE